MCFDWRLRQGNGESIREMELGISQGEKVAMGVFLWKKGGKQKVKGKIWAARTKQAELKAWQMEQERAVENFLSLPDTSGMELVPEQGFFG